MQALRLEPRGSNAHLEGRLIGEADKPGPARPKPSQRSPAAPWLIEQRCRIDASQSNGNADQRKAEYALSIETVNGTCWRSLQRYIKRAKSDVLCLQEHRISDQRKLNAASRWCANNGW